MSTFVFTVCEKEGPVKKTRKSAKWRQVPWEQRAMVHLPEAAEILTIGRSLAYEAAKAGDIPTLRFGKRLVVPTSWLKRMLEVGTAEQKTDA